MYEVYENNQWVARQPVQGERFRCIKNGKVDYESYWNDSSELPPISVSNIVITNSQLVGNIYWVAEGAQISITANVALPDGELMTMVEKVIDATNTVSDIRTKAVINSGVLTMSFSFKETGNYIFRKDRLNEGLKRIGANFSLDFEDVEFDVFV